MNPVRSFAPDLIANDFTAYWIYLVGPLAGATLAVVLAYALRGPGGGQLAREAAEGAVAAKREHLAENAAADIKGVVERDVDDIDAWIHRRHRTGQANSSEAEPDSTP